ncbi:hypothetical protein ACFSQD_07565 [Flavihumibacter stibioxidans]|uniref:HTH cro/C1-type domain-containing protein n=1 Tax=Flavihumibacter stibioxidans TaxID=1834163 RepID=A0ABR7M5Q0_9BACT|nr:hypothetical protein [Flavihumibacter stibioxidans]MBC6490169.1 hypothetical protein [Flavihumibacter stibioxidans]
MKKDEVPQDKRIIHGEDNSLAKVVYVTNQEGKYETSISEGWEAENLAMSQAWDEIDEKIEATRQKVLAGELSPIAYYMEKALMTPASLARYAGFWRFFVSRHLKPAGFKKLTDEKLQRYASVLGVAVDDLKHFSGK